MQTRWHRLIVFLAVGAIAAANCYGAPSAIAGHHPDARAVVQAADHYDHGSGKHNHDHDSTNGHAADHGEKTGIAGEPSKVCCTSMTCAGIAVLAGTSDAIHPLIAAAVSIALDDAVQTVAQGTIDPPPRLI
jgi:ABC-type nickel/cobalt efflux system permease component RcnA